MKGRLLVLAAVVLSALVAASRGAGSESGGTYGLKASLDARQQVPRQSVAVPAAIGTFAGTLRPDGTIVWTLSFSHLSGRALLAQIHVGALGRAGPIAVRLCGPCRSTMRGTATTTVKLVDAIENARAYVDVHTRKNPKGELRGQIRLIQGG